MDVQSEIHATHISLALEVGDRAKLCLGEETGPGEDSSLSGLLQADRVEEGVLRLVLVFGKIANVCAKRLDHLVDLDGRERVERVSVSGLGGGRGNGVGLAVAVDFVSYVDHCFRLYLIGMCTELIKA